MFHKIDESFDQDDEETVFSILRNIPIRKNNMNNYFLAPTDGPVNLI